MSANSVLTVPLDPALSKDLDSLAAETRRTRASLATEAIAHYVALQNWQIAKIKAGVAAAERGDFASDDELAAMLARHGLSA